MSEAVHLELAPDDAARLERLACQWGQSPAAAAALLIGKRLDQEEFPWLEFRDTVVGRQAFVRATGAAVWEVVFIAQSYGMDPRGAAEHFEWTEHLVRSVLTYAERHASEITPLVDDVRSIAADEPEHRMRGLQTPRSKA